VSRFAAQRLGADNRALLIYVPQAMAAELAA